MARNFSIDEYFVRMGLRHTPRFRFKGNDEQLAAMLGELSDKGIRVVTLREVPLSLEGAYMAISGIGDEEDQDEEEDAPEDSAEPSQSANSAEDASA